TLPCLSRGPVQSGKCVVLAVLGWIVLPQQNEPVEESRRRTILDQVNRNLTPSNPRWACGRCLSAMHPAYNLLEQFGEAGTNEALIVTARHFDEGSCSTP